MYSPHLWWIKLPLLSPEQESRFAQQSRAIQEVHKKSFSPRVMWRSYTRCLTLKSWEITRLLGRCRNFMVVKCGSEGFCCTCWFAGVIWSELWSDLLLETSYANASLQDFLGWKKRFNVTRIMSALQESTRNLPGNPAWNHGRQRDGWGLFQTWWEALLLRPQLFVWDPKKSSAMKRIYCTFS